MRDVNAFRERYKHWKETGELPYKAGRIVEQAEGNLPLPTYAEGKNDDDWLLNFVADREGYRKNVYNDTLANNIETIGYGFTDPAVINKYRRTGMPETVAKQILRTELNKRKIKLQQLVPHWNELTPNMQDSLTSYYYNFPFHNDPNSKAKSHYSPKLFKALENRDWQEAARQMDGGINQAKGLRNRRIAEQQHFLSNINLKRPSKTFTQPSLIQELEKQEKWQPNVEYPTQTQYEISQRVPQSISSWSSANSPAPFTRMPDLINIMDAYNKIVNEDSPLIIHKMDKGTEPKIEYVDDVKVDPVTGEAIMSDNTRGSVILPELTVRPQHLTKSAFDGYTRYLDDFVGFVPIAGDINDGINAGIALQNRNYSQAALLGAGLLLPNILEKPLRAGYKATKRYLNGSAIIDRMVGAMSDLNFARTWDDDVYTRWLLNGQKTPDSNIVYHGRPTYRGKPEDALRTYSNRDVGLHLTENEETARRFAKENGVVYKAIDKGIYPDAIYPDLGEWDAQVWKHNLDKAEKLTPELEREALEYQTAAVVDSKYGPYKAVQNILRDHNISPEDIQRMSRLHIFSGTDAEKLAANKEFANFLSRKGVNFRYKNDFEGGGFQKPSIFITDTSDLLWIPEIQMVEKQKRILPLLNWKTGQIERGTTSFPEYIEKFSNYNNGKSLKIK